MYWGVMGGQMDWGLIEEDWRKGPWTTEEDRLLIDYVRVHGEGRWNSVARLAGLKRNGKSCRLRWVNYLRPDLKRGQITPHEESIILELHARWGNRWSTIARSLPGRTDNEIKNYWRTHFKKKQAKPSLEPSSLEKAKARLLKKQQFQQQQQQQQQYLQHQQQQQEFDKVDLKKIAALLLDQETEQQQQLSVGPTQQPPNDQQSLVYSMLANEANNNNNNNNGSDNYYWPDHHHQASGNYDHFVIGVDYQANVWDWNLEDFHGSDSFGSACSTTTDKSAMHNLVLPFC